MPLNARAEVLIQFANEKREDDKTVDAQIAEAKGAGWDAAVTALRDENDREREATAELYSDKADFYEDAANFLVANRPGAVRSRRGGCDE